MNIEVKHLEDRDCDKCIYYENGSCPKWKCEYTTKEEEENN